MEQEEKRMRRKQVDVRAKDVVAEGELRPLQLQVSHGTHAG